MVIGTIGNVGNNDTTDVATTDSTTTNAGSPQQMSSPTSSPTYSPTLALDPGMSQVLDMNPKPLFVMHAKTGELLFMNKFGRKLLNWPASHESFDKDAILVDRKAENYKLDQNTDPADPKSSSTVTTSPSGPLLPREGATLDIITDTGPAGSSLLSTGRGKGGSMLIKIEGDAEMNFPESAGHPAFVGLTCTFSEVSVARPTRAACQPLQFQLSGEVLGNDQGEFLEGKKSVSLPAGTIAYGLDDSSGQRRMISKVFESCGVSDSLVEVYGDSTKDINKFASEVKERMTKAPAADVVLIIDESLGCDLPTGSQIARELLGSLENGERKRLTVFMRSANDDEATVKQFLTFADGFICKSCSVETSKRTVLDRLKAKVEGQVENCGFYRTRGRSKVLQVRRASDAHVRVHSMCIVCPM